MYIIFEMDFPKDRRKAIAAHLQKSLSQSGMAVAIFDSREITDLAADALATIYEANGAQSIIEDEKIDLPSILYSGYTIFGDETISPVHWLRATKAKADATLKIWQEAELLSAAIIITAEMDVIHEKNVVFKDDPHVIVRAQDNHPGLIGVSDMKIVSMKFENHLDMMVTSDVGISPEHIDDIDKGIGWAAFRVVRSKLMSGFKSE